VATSLLYFLSSLLEGWTGTMPVHGIFWTESDWGSDWGQSFTFDDHVGIDPEDGTSEDLGQHDWLSRQGSSYPGMVEILLPELLGSPKQKGKVKKKRPAATLRRRVSASVVFSCDWPWRQCGSEARSFKFLAYPKYILTVPSPQNENVWAALMVFRYVFFWSIALWRRADASLTFPGRV